MNSLLVERGSLIHRWTDDEPDALFQARAALRRSVEAHGLSACASDDAMMAVAELMANAVEHARGPYELHVLRSGSEFLCGVIDHDPRIPDVPAFPAVPAGAPQGCLHSGPASGGISLEDLEDLEERGRGLSMVHRLSRGLWGMQAFGSAKIVWCSLALT